MARLCLKKIHLIGFKSFADKTTLQFDQGVTAIVGPNGCGKSNVADAFRWVMGEQSAKSLRGEKMADVLFAGTAKRKEAPYCEVTLVFDNREGEFPISADEVAVSRRLNRKGDSDYRINGNGVRLKDVHHLFFDTGLGKEAFAIFEQGKIEEIIHRSAEERRPIFEQVSGIARYRHQWKEAERKLAQTNEHLTRLSDIASEVEKQVHLLEKQVAEASIYKQNKQRLEALEKGILSAKWRLLEKNAESAEQSLSELKGKKDRSKEINDFSLHTKDRAKEGLSEKEALLREALEALYTLRATFQVHEAESEGLATRLQEIETRASSCANELKRIEREQHAANQEAEGLREKQKNIHKKIEFADNDLEKSQEVLSDCQKALHRCQEEQIRLQKEQMDGVQKAHALSSRLKESEIRLEGIKERKGALTLKAETLKGVLKEQLELINERSDQADKLSIEVKGDREGHEKLGKELAAITSTLKEVQEQAQELEKAITKDQAEERILFELEEKGEGFSKGARLILEEFKGKVIPLVERVQPLPGREEEVASALQHYAYTLFATSDADFGAAWGWAQGKGISGFSITSSALLEGAKSPKSQSIASLSNLSPIAPLLESISTEEGTKGYLRADASFLDHAGVLFTAPLQNESPVIRKARLQALASSLKKQADNQALLNSQRDKWLVRQLEMLTKKATLEQNLRQGEMKLALLKASLERAKSDHENAQHKLNESCAESSSFEGIEVKLAKEALILKKELEKAHQTLAICQEEADRIAKELEGQLAGVREFAKGRRQREQRLHELSLDRHQIESSVSLIEAKRLNLQKEKYRLTLEKEELVEKGGKLRKAIEALEEPAEGRKELAKAEKKFALLEEEVKRGQEELSTLEKEGEKELIYLRELEKQGHALEVQMAKERAGASALAGEMLERFGQVISKEPSLLDAPLEEAEKEVRFLRKVVEEATAINLAAASEYDEKKQRHHFLSIQLDDLYKSKEELSEIIDELDRQSRERFQETFEAIRVHFQEQFQILFDGGAADLTFTGSEDILQAGIDIIAQPPGKKMRSIKLLSGGEKCLTAMALLFALFKVRPAPFCILDEMDAPLDDSNVERFINIIKPFMDKTQFLIITHNKQAMKAADTLFGVSMEEKGVSKVLSLAFERKTESLEAVLM